MVIIFKHDLNNVCNSLSERYCENLWLFFGLFRSWNCFTFPNIVPLSFPQYTGKISQLNDRIKNNLKLFKQDLYVHHWSIETDSDCKCSFNHQQNYGHAFFQLVFTIPNLMAMGHVPKILGKPGILAVL